MYIVLVVLVSLMMPQNNSAGLLDQKDPQTETGLHFNPPFIVRASDKDRPMKSIPEIVKELEQWILKLEVAYSETSGPLTEEEKKKLIADARKIVAAAKASGKTSDATLELQLLKLQLAIQGQMANVAELKNVEMRLPRWAANPIWFLSGAFILFSCIAYYIHTSRKPRTT